MSTPALDLAFCVAGLPFSGDTLAAHSLGGSETAGLCLAREMAKLGHHVQMFCNTPKPGVYDGVQYRDLGEFVRYARMAPHDVTIVQRMPHVFSQRTNSRLNVLWCHDLALGRNTPAFRSALWNIDKVAVLSDFMAAQYREVNHLEDAGDLLWTTRNGIDLDLFPAAPHDPLHLVFGARPERGLDVLLEFIFPKLLEHEPWLTLSLASYGNAVPELRDFYDHCAEAIERLGPRCRHLEPLTKRDYYALLASAGVYVYPTPSPSHKGFAEVSCITAMECMAVGLPIVTSQRGALPETIAPGAGTLLEGDPWDPAYQEAFVEAVLRYVRHPDAYARASRAGRERAATLGWPRVAEQWTEDLSRFIAERNDSPARLVHQCIRRSDIMAAKPIVAEMPPSDEQARFAGRMATEWGFADRGAEGLREQYAAIGQTHTDHFAVQPGEPRFALLDRWLGEHAEAQRVLDFGCAHGGYTIGLANRHGRTWLGLDVDPHAVDMARAHQVEHLTHASASVRFQQGDAAVDLSDEAPFDTLVAFEVLEHVQDPASVLDALERWVRPDGWVVITVPYGPWEWLSYRENPYRAHLWEFDLHDLRDLFAKKKHVRVSAVMGGIAPPLDEPLGWHFIEYQVDGTPTGTIDLTRKRRLQRPRATVSLVMIAGPGAEQTLAWSLAPVRDLVDELLIGDCGMSEAARQIARDHGARLIPASDPLVTGFSVPRNEVLAHATGDWVLCHDTDERLVGGPRLLKYLRTGGYFTGFSITQHNFTCETHQDALTPIRCWRRTPRADGARMQWYGLIHEHPEYALNAGPGPWLILPDVHLAHIGYLTDQHVETKFNRNQKLLRRDLDANPDRVIQKHFLCRDLMAHVAAELMQSRQVRTPEITAKCREVLKIYREHFLGKPNHLNNDTRQYYARALEVLGEGIEVSWAFGADRHASTLGEPIKSRYATVEEVEEELLWRVREAVKPRLSAWW